MRQEKNTPLKLEIAACELKKGLESKHRDNQT